MGVSRKKLVVGQHYTHYRSGVDYTIIDFAINPNTNVIIAIYREMGKAGLASWRPIDEFCSKFSRAKKRVKKKETPSVPSG